MLVEMYMFFFLSIKTFKMKPLLSHMSSQLCESAFFF